MLRPQFGYVVKYALLRIPCFRIPCFVYLALYTLLCMVPLFSYTFIRYTGVSDNTMKIIRGVSRRPRLRDGTEDVRSPTLRRSGNIRNNIVKIIPRSVENITRRTKNKRKNITRRTKNRRRNIKNNIVKIIPRRSRNTM